MLRMGWKVERVAVSKEDPVPDALDPDKTKEKPELFAILSNY